MSVKYAVVYNCCVEKHNELGIQFDFDNNEHLQHPSSMEDIFKNLVYHCKKIFH